MELVLRDPGKAKGMFRSKSSFTTRSDSLMSWKSDDVVFSFSKQEEADRFYDEIKKRLALCNLEMSKETSNKIDFSPKSENNFHFVNFTFFWGKNRGSSKIRFKVKTKKERLNKAIKDANTWLNENLNRYTTDRIWNHIKSILRGHFSYFGISYNRSKRLYFYYEATRLTCKLLNRRSQRKSIICENFKKMLLQNPMPFPPDVRKLKHLIDRGIYVY